VPVLVVVGIDMDRFDDVDVRDATPVAAMERRTG
jgi:hypothetical protein